MKLLFHKACSRRLRDHNKHEMFKSVYHKLYVVIRLNIIDL